MTQYTVSLVVLFSFYSYLFTLLLLLRTNYDSARGCGKRVARFGLVSTTGQRVCKETIAPLPTLDNLRRRFPPRNVSLSPDAARVATLAL